MSRSSKADLAWDPEKILSGDPNEALVALMRRADLILNFAGENIASGRLDEAHVRRLIQSRVKATEALAKIWKVAGRPGLLWVQASAVGYYGEKGEGRVNEEAPRGNLRLSEICAANEAVASVVEKPLRVSGGRMVVIRLGTVFDSDAASWKKMTLASRSCAGGRMGKGSAWWAWIHMTDILKALQRFWENKNSQGTYNLVAPEPCRQGELSRQMARYFDRPLQFPAPAWALRLAFGRLADEIFLTSCRAVPDRLLQEGFEFSYPSFASALPALAPKG